MSDECTRYAPCPTCRAILQAIYRYAIFRRSGVTLEEAVATSLSRNPGADAETVRWAVMADSENTPQIDVFSRLSRSNRSIASSNNRSASFP
ncbi:MAG: hypothetical protein ACYDCO_17135 [Armatimonadota bacterium]